MYNDKHIQSIMYQKVQELWNAKWEEVKLLILPCLAPVEWRPKMDMAHASFLDFSIYYYIQLEIDKAKQVIWVNHTALRNWGVSMHTLKVQAIKNMEKHGYAVQPIEKVIPVPKGETYVPLYLLTNQTTFFGATGILNADMLAAFAEEINQNLYIIPSSVHELLFLPDDGLTDVRDLKKIIKDINSTLVEPQDRLSDHAYYYNRITDEIRMEKQENES